ncbi:hypothetical protein EMCRGX_G008985 [Ephydatia muelleri]
MEQRVLSPRDNHTVAVVKMLECHDILATTLEPLLQEIKLLMESQIIEVEGKQYQVELFLGGDLKDFEELHTNISSWTPDSDVIESKATQ